MKIAKAKLKKMARELLTAIDKPKAGGIQGHFDTVLYYLNQVNNGTKKKAVRKAARKVKCEGCDGSGWQKGGEWLCDNCDAACVCKTKGLQECCIHRGW